MTARCDEAQDLSPYERIMTTNNADRNPLHSTPSRRLDALPSCRARPEGQGIVLRLLCKHA